MEEKVEVIRNIIADNQKEKRKILVLYSVFFSSFFAIFIPLSLTAVFAVMMNVCTLAAIYSVRSNAEEDSLTENHMTFLIRTFWKTNLFFLISSTLSLLYLTFFADYAPLMPCLSYIESNIVTIVNHWVSNDFFALVKRCSKPFFSKNMPHIVLTTIIAFAPILLYILSRFFKGWRLILKNKMVPNSKL